MRIMNKVIWPYQVKVNSRTDWDEILDWCDTKLTSRYYVNNNTFCFKTSEDSLLFSLRWL
jgi:hypothetical protein